jgi:L-fuconolactonase
MKIDSHQHFWKYSPDGFGWITENMSVIRRDFLPEDLKPELDRAGFDGCVAVQASQTEAETQFLLDLAGQYPFIKGVVGWVDLRATNAAERLAHFSKHPKMVGIRHVVQSEPDDRFLLRPDFMRGIKLLKQYKLTYDILIYPKHLPAAVEFVAQFPDQPFVLDHIAKPLIKAKTLSPWNKEVRRLAANPNVYCKLSGMVTEADWQEWKPGDFIPYLDVVVEAFGIGRLMIGSDWPVCRLAAQYGEVMQAKILGGNAFRFYGLPA